MSRAAAARFCGSSGSAGGDAAAKVAADADTKPKDVPTKPAADAAPAATTKPTPKVPSRQREPKTIDAVAGVTPGERLSSLRRMLRTENRILRGIEVHSGLSAIIADQASATRPDGSRVSYDFVWSSSLTSSSVKGKPDIETVTTSERVSICEDALEVSSKPMIYDGDTGGEKEIFRFTVQRLERIGISMVIIEDKAGLKQNSLFGTERKQQLEDVDVFCNKIRAGKRAQLTADFMIVARIEALIAGLGEEEALMRARAYIEKGGADGIMIHSKQKSPDEVVSWLRRFRAEYPDVPVIVVPSTYSSIHEDELYAEGANICIYANQLVRAAYPAMLAAANGLLADGRAKDVDSTIMTAKSLISLIDDHH